MNDKTMERAHWSFWVISVVALIWNVLGGVNFMVQLNGEAVASMPDTHRAIIEGRPAWATAGFAVGVFGGAIGCLLLLFRSPAARYLFVVSLLGMVVTMIHTVNIARFSIDFSILELVIMILMPLVVSIFLIWYAARAQGRGWLK